MINYSETAIESLSIHFVGVNTDKIGVSYTNDPVDVQTDEMHGYLLQYFLSSFKKPEFFNFHMPGEELDNNPLARMVSDIFDDPSAIHEMSKRIGDYLYAKSSHPKINSGDLIVCYFNDLIVEDEMLSGIGIFKNEDKDAFLKFINREDKFDIKIDHGFGLDKLQKGALILNTEKEEGFKLCIVDRNSRADEAQYWKHDFLNVRNRIDSYHMTADTILATKSFIDEQLKVSAEVDPADEADILNKAKNYFRSLERFNETEYENNLFEKEETKLQFQDYKRQYEEQKNVELPAQFDISQPAVRSHNGVFKSVIKLDRNFHIYVHGDRSKIFRGTDEAGRKYYKIYYDVEA